MCNLAFITDPMFLFLVMLNIIFTNAETRKLISLSSNTLLLPGSNKFLQVNSVLFVFHKPKSQIMIDCRAQYAKHWATSIKHIIEVAFSSTLSYI